MTSEANRALTLAVFICLAVSSLSFVSAQWQFSAVTAAVAFGLLVFFRAIHKK